VTAHLSDEDNESILRAGQILRGRGWSQTFSLNEMLRSWSRLVAEIERGYDQMVDEYTNDLSCRDWLAAAWPLFSDRVRDLRQPELDAIDERFRTATVDDEGQALGQFTQIESKDGWWWRRLPSRRTGTFAAEVGAGETAP
jgi:hypothetical protein